VQNVIIFMPAEVVGLMLMRKLEIFLRKTAGVGFDVNFDSFLL